MRWICLVGAVAAVGVGAEASACSIVVTHEPTPYEKMRRARETIAEAAAVIDGEVIAPYRSEEEPAVVRAEHVLKGPAKVEFKVAAPTSCHEAFTEVGLRARMVLYGGPDVYTAPDTQTEARYEDKVLKSDRRRVWPWTPAPKPPAR